MVADWPAVDNYTSRPLAESENDTPNLIGGRKQRIRLLLILWHFCNVSATFDFLSLILIASSEWNFKSIYVLNYLNWIFLKNYKHLRSGIQWEVPSIPVQRIISQNGRMERWNAGSAGSITETLRCNWYNFFFQTKIFTKIADHFAHGLRTIKQKCWEENETYNFFENWGKGRMISIVLIEQVGRPPALQCCESTGPHVAT